MSVLLETKNVRVDYGSLVALRDFSITLSAGDLLGMIGPNGAGKTTALKVIAGLVPETAGTVHVLGDRVAPGNVRTLSQIGFAADTPPVYEDLTIEDFLGFIGRAYRLRTETINERIDYWLEQLWLSDRRGSRIKTLSRGMRQRLIVARTLLPDPPLILLDEPAGGLDPAGRVQFRRMLAGLRDHGKALIVSSHILADLHEYCTHIVIMERGRIERMGTVAQVVGGQDDHRRRYDVVLARPEPMVSDMLASIPGVEGVQIDGRMISFEFEDSEAAASELLKSLVQRGLPVARFGPVAHDLEQAYLRTGIRQVD